MTGSQFLAYVLRKGFKRTDKDTELYEAATDAVEEMRRRLMFDEAEIDAATTDTISTLGDYKLTIETDLGLVLGIILQDGTTATQLNKRDKAYFDGMYPDAAVTNDRGYPVDFCIYAGSIYLGPVPDQTSYTYRISYSSRASAIVSGTTSVPFTNVYRGVLTDLVLALLYEGLEDYDKAVFHRNRYEAEMERVERRERMNAGQSAFVMRPLDC